MPRPRSAIGRGEPTSGGMVSDPAAPPPWPTTLIAIVAMPWLANVEATASGKVGVVNAAGSVGGSAGFAGFVLTCRFHWIDVGLRLASAKVPSIFAGFGSDCLVWCR